MLGGSGCTGGGGPPVPSPEHHPGPTWALPEHHPGPTWASPEHHPVPPGHHPAPQHPSLCPIWSPCVIPPSSEQRCPGGFRGLGKGGKRSPGTAGMEPEQEPPLSPFSCPTCAPAAANPPGNHCKGHSRAWEHAGDPLGYPGSCSGWIS